MLNNIKQKKTVFCLKNGIVNVKTLIKSKSSQTKQNSTWIICAPNTMLLDVSWRGSCKLSFGI